MSDTCIVCLGDLGEPASNALAPRLDIQIDELASNLLTKADGSNNNNKNNNTDRDVDQIAHLLPCGHTLHNNCLKPWVERANSCPICRRNFNVVELSDKPGGPVTSSYIVEDRVQVAEVDPSMLIDFVDEDFTDFQPCPICGDADNEELLLLCDGCDVPSHTYCVGLDDVPYGPWYCDQCETHRVFGSASPSTIRSSHGDARRPRRTRAQQRRAQTLNQANSLHWARVWQSVWDRLNIDLDFPFVDDRAAERELQERRREAAQQREFRAWQRRFEVAERQGGNYGFRDTASLLDIDAPRPSRPRVPRAPTPEPESLEEMRAWNAFERARELENNPNAARKRKDPTLSPSPEPAEPERKLKRPRTRRPEELAALAMQNGELSRARSTQPSTRIRADNTNEPSFLQSLLKEVEETSNLSERLSYGPSAPASSTPTNHTTPGPSSPSISPAPSNQSSPRLSSITPPPQIRARPVSPFQLSSPSDPSSPIFSPDVTLSVSTAQHATERKPSAADSPCLRPRRPRIASHTASARSSDHSPDRTSLSLAVKSEVQRLVGTVLKPYYRSKVVSKDEYTDINRIICRKLYQRLGDAESLGADAQADLEHIASKEVQGAIEALKEKKGKRKDGEEITYN